MPTPKAKTDSVVNFPRMWPRSFFGRLLICVGLPIFVLLINVLSSWNRSFGLDAHEARDGMKSPPLSVDGKRTLWEKTASPAHVKFPPKVLQKANNFSSPERKAAAHSAKVIQKSKTIWTIEDGALSFQVDVGKPTQLKGGDVQHVGEDCWDPSHCGRAGLCAWCGAGNACCREGFGDYDPAECRTARKFVAKKFHECVAVSMDVYKNSKATLLIDGMTVLSTSALGMWSVGRDLKDGWPTEWDSGGVEKVKIVGPWLMVKGSIKAPDGHWTVSDRWRIYDGVVEGFRDWSWAGVNGQKSKDTVLSISWSTVNGHGSGLVMPGVVYHGNPSGQKALKNGWALVPAWIDEDGYKLQVEEHRLAQTWASFEWTWKQQERDPAVEALGHQVVVALDSQPSAPPYAKPNKDVQWTLGAEATSNGATLHLLSGPVALNRDTGYVKSGQNSKTQFMEVGLSVPSGKRVQKRYRLHAGRPLRKGAGFRIPLEWSISRGDLSSDSLPRFPDIVEAKVRFALSRWKGDNRYPGFAMYPNNDEVYVMGWAGQAEAPGYALQVLADRLEMPELRKIAEKALDTLSNAKFNSKGFQLALNGLSGKWSQQDPVSQGQAMSAFARAIRYGRKSGANVVNWETFLRRACEVHASRILGETWYPRSTAEGFIVQPLALCAGLFNHEKFLDAALKAGNHYGSRHIGLREPFWGGTLDANCEDKEGAWAGFEAFLALHEATGDVKWLEAANYAADFTLTYTYLWDVNLPPGRLRDHDLKTRGWTAVSVQNMHLDVYGVLYTPRLWRLGELSNRPELFRLAELMYRSCGQMIDAKGSQGEQLQQTRFAQAGDLKNPDRFRGGYVESWTVFWIAAHFLTAAAQFEEMGVLSTLWGRI